MKKKIGIGTALAILAILLWWLVFGTGMLVVKSILGMPTYTGGEHLYMTKEQVEEWKKQQKIGNGQND